MEKLISLKWFHVSGCAKLNSIQGMCEAEQHTRVGALGEFVGALS